VTWRFHFANTWRLYPAHYKVPVASDQDKTLLTAANLFEQLGQTILTMASAKLKHIAAICQLSMIMSGQLNFPLLRNKFVIWQNKLYGVMGITTRKHFNTINFFQYLVIPTVHN
jgi:hypothetical protein